MTEYLSAAETAKLIRAQLKKHFPTCKFYVNSKVYSGGASIDIDWIDGPTENEVKRITSAFNGAGFDGMVDYKTSHDAYLLPDGSAAFAKTEDNYYTTTHYTAPTPEAKQVHFGADYVFTSRSYSPEFVNRVLSPICAEYGVEMPELYAGKMYRGGAVTAYPHFENLGRYDEYTRPWERTMSEALRNTSATESATIEEPAQEEIKITWDREWTWITFPAKPSEAVRDMLKNIFKARWSSKREAWYVTETIDETTIRTQLAIA